MPVAAFAVYIPDKATSRGRLRRYPGQAAGFTMAWNLTGDEAMSASRTGSHRDLRILVVEDNLDAAESLRQLLCLCGCQVVVAHTSREGLDAASWLRPHIVLCDIGLPDSDG